MDAQVQQIKDRINIVDVVGQYVTLKRAGRSYTARCPFHKERTPSFHVSPERGTYMCFGCGEKGDVFSFIQKMDGVDFPTALKQMAEKAGVTLEPRQFRQKAPDKEEKEERLRQACEAAVKYFESELVLRKDVQEYVRTRGVKDETVLAWRVGYAPASWDKFSAHLKSQGFTNDELVEAGFSVRSDKRPGEVFDRFRGRIIFPIFDAGGVPIAVSGRFFEAVPGSKQEGEPAKYVNSPETVLFKKSRVLYGLNVARSAIRKADCILLVEGQFDLILAHQSGLPFTVALSGTALTEEHLNILGRLSKRLVLALDGDQAGIRAGLKSAHMALMVGFDVKVPTFPQGQDPADLARENPELLKAAVRTSKTAVEFFLEALRPGTRDERAYKKAVEMQVLPLIGAIGSRIEQEHFIRLVAARIGVSDLAVRAEVDKRPQLSSLEDSPEVHQIGAQSKLPPLDRKAAMLLFYFGKDSEVGSKLGQLLTQEKLDELILQLEPRAEEFRFSFEAELGVESEQTIAGDMLGDITKAVEKERFKMKFL